MSDATVRRRTANGEMNRLQAEDRAAHRWYRFVLSFPPHLVRDYLERFGIGHQHQVLDPFCGTGTTLVECKKRDIPSVGIEANPLAQFASAVKVDWSPDPEGLLAHARKVAGAATVALAEDGIEDEPTLQRPQPADHRSLPPEKAALLLSGSISPLPLHKTLALLECLERLRDDRYHRHELLALARALSASIGNLHFGPEVGVGRPKPHAPVLAPWLNGVRAMADDLREVAGKPAVPATAHLADARRLSGSLAPDSIDAVITSPPYPNEKDYTRTTRLEAVLLGFITDRAGLTGMKQTLMRSNSRNVYRGDDDHEWVASQREIQRVADAIEARRIDLGKTSGFERQYAKVTRLYFGGMTRHLAELRDVLRPGAQLAYVVGDQASYLRVMIRTGELLASIAAELGYEVTGIDLFRTRLATATRQQLREEIVLLRWPGGGRSEHTPPRPPALP